MITAFFVFSLVSLTGTAMLGRLIKENRLFVLLPAGMLSGTALYILLLNLMFSFLPGKPGIVFSTILIAITAVYYSSKYHFKLPDGKIVLNFILPLITMGGFLYFIQARMETILPVADSTIQWAYAATFARGNFPLMTPWQPDIIPTYHMGAYFFEGALHSLSGLPWLTIHTLINIFFIFSASLMTVFLLWENKYSFKNLWLVSAALFVFLSFGVISIAIPSNLSYFIPSPEKFDLLTNTLTSLPQKGTAGAALVDFNSLSYLPARSLSIGLALLLLYFFITKWNSAKGKIICCSLILSTIAFVEESIFLPLFLVLTISCLLAFTPKLQPLKKQRVTLLAITIITIILTFLQGGFVSTLLNPKQDHVFNITLPTTESRFFEKIQKIKGDNVFISNVSSGTNTYTPNPLMLLIPVLLYAITNKKKILLLLGGFSLTSILAFLFIEYKYDLSNNIRFYNFGYISAGLAFGYTIFYLLKKQTYSLNLTIFLLLTPILFIPSFLPEEEKQAKALQEGRKINIAASVWSTDIPNSPFEQISNWAAKKLPPNARLLVLGKNSLTPESAVQFQYKGLYTIFGPQNIRVLRQEPGIEYFDLSLTLNPSLIKRTKTEYVYIESDSPAFKQLPQFRKDDLADSNYFEILQSIELSSKDQISFYKLYKVKPEFVDPMYGGKDIKQGTLEQLNSLIPKNATVYISDYGGASMLNFWYRMSTILSMKDKILVRNPQQTDYMAIETPINYRSSQPGQIYDYYILASEDKPKIPAELIWSNIYASAWKSN